MFQRFCASVLVITCWWSGAAVSQSVKSPQNVLARAGDLFVTEKEFVERFELLPALQRNRKSRLEESKLELLYSIIAEKLLAQEAQQRKLDQDPAFVASFGEVRKLLARDQLYREEVSSKVNVSEAEVRKGISEAVREVLLSYLFFDNREDAIFVRKQIKTEHDFDHIRIDSSLHAVRDTATVIWSDAEPAIERIAYKMKRGEISPEIRASAGY